MYTETTAPATLAKDISKTFESHYAFTSFRLSSYTRWRN